MLTALGMRARRLAARDPWTNVYGIARTLLALGTGLTLLVNRADILFRPAAGLPDCPLCSGPARFSFFCLFPKDRLELARWLAFLTLAIVASGWRPRLTGPVHWWIAFSLIASAVAVDGGDHVTAVLTLLLLPVTLTDARVWHWSAPAEQEKGETRRLVAWSALLAIRLQVAGIYFHAAVSKCRVTEWVDGTVLYYWLTDPGFGSPPWLRPLLMPILTHAATVALATWGVLVLEIALSMALVAPERARGGFLLAGIALHGGIALLHGLISFAIAMTAALILYLRAPDRPFRSPLRRSRGSAGLRAAAPIQGPAPAAAP